MKFKKLLILSILVLSQSFSHFAIAGDGKLLFAGFAFSGNYGNRVALYPYTSALIEKNPDFIDELIRRKLNNQPELLNKLSLEKGNIKEDITSVACALVMENVEVQKIDSKNLVVVLMQANVMGFNRASNSIVASYPLRMRFSRLLDSEPTANDLEAIIREVYTSKNPSENILDQWLIKLKTASFKAGATKYLRVSDVTVEPEAEAILQQSSVNLSAFKNQTANLLEASLADKSNVPIVPNTVGEVIGNKIALRFASAEALNISLPDPDYAVSFVIRGFASKKTESQGAFTDIYRAKATITIKLPETGTTYIDEQIYETLFVTRPKSSNIQLTDRDQYFKSLQSLIYGLGIQLNNPEEIWLKEHAARAVDSKSAFLKVKKLLQELR
jgi:hypothetical protein